MTGQVEFGLYESFNRRSREIFRRLAVFDVWVASFRALTEVGRGRAMMGRVRVT